MPGNKKEEQTLIGDFTSASVYDELILNYSESYCIFNAEDKLTAYSSEFPSMYPTLVGDIKLGITYSEYLRNFITKKAIKNISKPDDLDNWIEGQTADVRRIPKFVHHLIDGRWMEIKTHAASNGDFMFIASDISEHVHQQEELKQATKKYESFAKLAADWFWELDADLNYLFHSNHKLMATGQDGRDKVGHSRIKLLENNCAKDDQLAEHNLCLVEHRPVDVILTLLSDTGHKSYCHIKATPRFDSSQRFLGYIGYGRDVTEQTQLKQQLQSHARVDFLTNLLNKRAFEEELGEAHLRYRVNNETTTICVMDLDRFKIVNDECGHAAGDELLKSISTTFTNMLPEHAVIGRIGGDEFAVLLTMNVEDTFPFLDKLILQINNAPFSWNEKQYFIGLSIGVTEIDPALEPMDSLQQADNACYTAKKNGRGRVVIYGEREDSNVFLQDNASGTANLTDASSENHVATNELDLKPIVAILIDNLHSYQKYICNSIARVLWDAGYRSANVVLCNNDLEVSSRDGRSKSLLPRLLTGDNIAGAIALSSSVGAKMSSTDFQTLVDWIDTVPVVYHGYADPHTAQDAVVLDNKSSMYDLLDHITSDPSRKILCFVRGFGEQSDSIAREQAFRDYLTEKNLPIKEELFLDGYYREAITHKVVTELLHSGQQPDAILAANDNMAVAAIRAVQEFGLEVPSDVVVTGFDDRRLATECNPPLTTIRVDLEAQGSRSAALILERIEEKRSAGKTSNNPVPPRTEFVESRLIVRDSTGGYKESTELTGNSDSTDPLDVAFKTSVSNIVRILDNDMDQKQTHHLNLSSRFIETLEQDTDAFETAIPELRSDLEREFDGYNVKLELHSAIGNLLMIMLQAGRIQVGFKRLARIKNELSQIVYDEQAQQALTGARNEQIYDVFHSGILQCQNLEGVVHELDSVLTEYNVTTAFLVLDNTMAIFDSASSQASFDHYLVYARTNGQSELSARLEVPESSLLPARYTGTAVVHGVLIHPIVAQGIHSGYLVIDVSTLESTVVSKITSCVAVALLNCNQYEEQKRYTEQLRSINAELARKTNFDSTTGLPNRKQFLATVNQSLYTHNQNDTRFMIMLVSLSDLNQFTLQHGENNSDFLIRSIATRVVTAVANQGQVFRTGSVDFSIIMECSPDTQPQECIDDVMLAFEQPVEVSGHDTKITPYSGIAVYPPHGFDSEELINNATIAMNTAENRSSSSPVVFDPTLSQEGINKWQLDQQMREGLDNKEFCLYFQPRINGKSGDIESFEVLIRWFRPENGKEAPVQIGPYIFIPVAEETGLILQIGEFVLAEACRQLEEWRREGLDIRLSVNLSTKELEQPDLLPRIAKTLSDNNLESHAIELEVTESAAMLDIETSIAKLGELQNQGFEIAIDDFGTDYSSLNYLKRLPANYLKIDRSFVMDICEADGGDSADAAIIRAIVTLGHSLGHKIVAEGVETQEQLEFLQSLQVDQIQGYYFSPPVDAQAAKQMLIEQYNSNSVTPLKKIA